MRLFTSAKRWIFAVAFLAVSVVPRVAFACPMCFASSTGPVLRAFYLTAVGLTLLPLLIFGGIVGGIRYFRRRAVDSAETTVVQAAEPTEIQGPNLGV